jgi:hypothetical protein
MIFIYPNGHSFKCCVYCGEFDYKLPYDKKDVKIKVSVLNCKGISLHYRCSYWEDKNEFSNSNITEKESTLQYDPVFWQKAWILWDIATPYFKETHGLNKTPATLIKPLDTQKYYKDQFKRILKINGD